MEEILLQIKIALETYVKTSRKIKAIFLGENAHITNFDFPCIVISPASTIINIADNTRDEDYFAVNVSVITDAKDTMGNDTIDYRENKESTACVLILEERESSSMKIKEDTVIGALRKHFYRKSPYTLKNNIRVSYPPMTNPKYPSFEGIAEVSFTSQIYDRI